MEGGIKTRTAPASSCRASRTGASAWYAVPWGTAGERLAGSLLEVPGYGGILPLPIHLVQYGYATLTLYPRGQGESLKEWQIEHGTRMVYNVTDRERYYYRGAYMDCVRGVDFLCSRPEIDTSRIGVWGFSQGGGLSLATAALDRPHLGRRPGCPGCATSRWRLRSPALHTLSYTTTWRNILVSATRQWPPWPILIS